MKPLLALLILAAALFVGACNPGTSPGTSPELSPEVSPASSPSA